MFGGGRHFGLRGQRLNLAVTTIAGLDFALFGYDQGVMGGLLTLPSFVATFPEIDTVHDTSNYTSTIQGISVASYNLGCFVGAIVTIFIGDILGRRRMIFLGSSIMIIGAILQASAFSLGQLIAGRVITGFGNGMSTSTVPTWASETSRSHKRGKMVMIEGTMITGGIALSYWLDFAFSFLEPSTVAWRFPIAFQIVPALLLLAFILELPESPRWLVLKGQEDEAKSVLSALADLPPDDHLVRTEFAEIKDTVLEMSSYGYRDLFTMGPERHFHRVVLAYFIQVFQQISGINLITYYAATIFEKYIGLDGQTSRILAAANGTEYFLASFVAIWTIERFGRRDLMLWSSVGMVASMVILAIMNYLSEKHIGGSRPGVVSAVFLFVFNSAFAVGWLSIPWLLPAELVPLKIRAPANGLSTSANWIFNFMVVMITPVAFNSIGYKTYIIFAVINVFIMPVIYFFYPETAYRSLEEIDTIFIKTKSWFGAVSVARHQPSRYGRNGELLIDYENTEDRIHRDQSAADGREIGKEETSSGNGTAVHAENTLAGGDSEESVADPEKGRSGVIR
ncbi:sugar transporter STL1 [Sclerotinia borealis F-4128]|uniref:Sugar transporter STL1 n=1 Tax=Sclerotinia borealis (strain F-4128) TaxID=1432307 RepID=W9CLI5_SCLBF|nr:sugar transporter STL1 [Sclerotinia borealis F-4128]